MNLLGTRIIGFSKVNLLGTDIIEFSRMNFLGTGIVGFSKSRLLISIFKALGWLIVNSKNK